MACLACSSSMSKGVLAYELTGNLTHGDQNQATINSPPRLQWNANQGYCGEVSMISAGLRYGQYASQYEARAIASNNTNQGNPHSQLLLGINAMWAAEQMRLKAETWDNSGAPDAPAFLSWVKEGILSDSSVMIGIYTNEFLFYHNTNPNAGQNSYDHIVPVCGISSDLKLNAEYHPNDTITFSDNGLWAPHNKPSYIWQYDMKSFQSDRKDANLKSAAVYSLPSTVKNYGMVISGIIDEDNQTLPVHLSTDPNYEKPSIKKGSNVRPKPEKLILTITVSSVNPGQSYTLYRYDDFSKVPTSSFNAQHAQAAMSWQIRAQHGSSYTFSETISSDQVAVYRAVPVTAP